MPLHYNRNSGSPGHGHGHGDSQWTSYSDLFMGLSVVFLLLYVTASLRTGTAGLQQQIQNERMTQEITDLKNQLKAYNSIKKDYLKTEATEDDQEMYKQLMDKLSLLKEEAKTEKDRLRIEALENERKEKALNQYQQMVRNIVNANMVAKSRIKKRDDIIDEQDTEIVQQDQKINKLSTEVSENKKKIEAAEEELQDKVSRLKQAYKENAISKKSFEKQVAALKEASEEKVSELTEKQKIAQAKLAQAQQELNQTSEQLAATENQLEKTSGQLAQTKTQLTAKEREKQELAGKLALTTKSYEDKLAQADEEFNKQLAEAEAAMKNRLASQEAAHKGKLAAREAELEGKLSEAEAAQKAKLAALDKAYQDRMGKLKGEFAAQQAKDKAAFEEALGKERLTGEEKAKREAAYRAEADRRAKDMGDKLARAEKDYQGKIGELGGKLKETEGALATAKADLEAKKRVAKDMEKAFKAAGINAEVDPETGDVVLDFGGHYFATGSSKLNEEMQKTLEKAFPIYAKTLFENSKISKKLAFVEIIGFASPTWKGKQVDPDSLSTTDRKAVDYNLDLSYNRAKAIFNHISDPAKMSFTYQKDIQPLVKVSGRSFFSESKGARAVAGGKTDYCGKGGDCKKAQKVIIKFSLDNK